MFLTMLAADVAGACFAGFVRDLKKHANFQKYKMNLNGSSYQIRLGSRDFGKLFALDRVHSDNHWHSMEGINKI